MANIPDSLHRERGCKSCGDLEAAVNSGDERKIARVKKNIDSHLTKLNKDRDYRATGTGGAKALLETSSRPTAKKRNDAFDTGVATKLASESEDEASSDVLRGRLSSMPETRTVPEDSPRRSVEALRPTAEFLRQNQIATVMSEETGRVSANKAGKTGLQRERRFVDSLEDSPDRVVNIIRGIALAPFTDKTTSSGATMQELHDQVEEHLNSLGENSKTAEGHNHLEEAFEHLNQHDAKHFAGYHSEAFAHLKKAGILINKAADVAKNAGGTARKAVLFNRPISVAKGTQSVVDEYESKRKAEGRTLDPKAKATLPKGWQVASIPHPEDYLEKKSYDKEEVPEEEPDEEDDTPEDIKKEIDADFSAPSGTGTERHLAELKQREIARRALPGVQPGHELLNDTLTALAARRKDLAAKEEAEAARQTELQKQLNVTPAPVRNVTAEPEGEKINWRWNAKKGRHGIPKEQADLFKTHRDIAIKNLVTGDYIPNESKRVLGEHGIKLVTDAANKYLDTKKAKQQRAEAREAEAAKKDAWSERGYTEDTRMDREKDEAASEAESRGRGSTYDDEEDYESGWTPPEQDPNRR
jgi:hypothetical protein